LRLAAFENYLKSTEAINDAQALNLRSLASQRLQRLKAGR
jgi:hypothetical protein